MVTRQLFITDIKRHRELNDQRGAYIKQIIKDPRQNPGAHHRVEQQFQTRMDQVTQKNSYQRDRRRKGGAPRDTHPLPKPFNHDPVIHRVKSCTEIEQHQHGAFTLISRHHNVIGDSKKCSFSWMLLAETQMELWAVRTAVSCLATTFSRFLEINGSSEMNFFSTVVGRISTGVEEGFILPTTSERSCREMGEKT